VSTPHPRHVERLRKMKQRLAVRSWEYRQRNASKGVWDRLRRMLALSERAFVLDDRIAADLIASGVLPEPVGAELEPPRRYFVLAASQIAAVAGAREITVSLDAQFLASADVALVRFVGIDPRR
jgi:hypothetical protein